ncbi:sialidase family protein, partial [Singulisphaera rosea]
MSSIFMDRRFSVLALLSALIGTGPRTTGAGEAPGVITSEFLYADGLIPSCHASTIAESKGGLVAAWFGGTDEGIADVGIWVSRKDGEHWSRPVEVVNGKEGSGRRYPCWNPVLASLSEDRLLLYYKVGPSPRDWWGMQIVSADGGKTWGKPELLPEGILGPIKNKLVRLADGTLLSPSSTEDHGFRVHLERSSDGGATWSKTKPLNDGHKFDAIQPTVLTYGPGSIQILCRTDQKRIFESWSSDAGLTWTPLQATSLPNPDSGIDAVTLKDGRALLIYNHTP